MNGPSATYFPVTAFCISSAIMLLSSLDNVFSSVSSLFLRFMPLTDLAIIFPLSGPRAAKVASASIGNSLAADTPFAEDVVAEGFNMDGVAGLDTDLVVDLVGFASGVWWVGSGVCFVDITGDLEGG